MLALIEFVWAVALAANAQRLKDLETDDMEAVRSELDTAAESLQNLAGQVMDGR